jgi:DNA primase
MEGYMDVIASHQHGLKTACAPLGTALTPEHAVLLKRFADSAVIVFDADAAGQSAAVRGAEVALAAGLGVRVASVPEGKDPDEFLHAKGLPAFEKALEAATDLVEFKTDLLIKRAGELTPEAKSAIAKDVLSTIAQCPDEVLKDEWVRLLAARLGVNEDSLRRAGGKLIPQSRRSASAAAAPTKPAPAAPAAPAELTPADRQLLGVLLKTPESAGDVPEAAFESGAARLILLNLRAAAPYDKGWGPRLLSALPPAESSAASALLADEHGYGDAAGVLRDLLGKRARLKRFSELQSLMTAAGNGRPVDPALRDEYQRLVVEIKGAKR